MIILKILKGMTMLILLRRTGEKIIIDTGTDIIEVSLLKPHNQTGFYVGIKAAPHIKIDREEIYLNKKLFPKKNNDQKDS